MSLMKDLLGNLDQKAWLILDRCPDGYHAFVLEDLFQNQKDRSVIFVAPDEGAMEMTYHLLNFINPGLPVKKFPAWDCLPYDRMSPRIDIMAERMATLG